MIGEGTPVTARWEAGPMSAPVQTLLVTMGMRPVNELALALARYPFPIAASLFFVAVIPRTLFVVVVVIWLFLFEGSKWRGR